MKKLKKKRRNKIKKNKYIFFFVLVHFIEFSLAALISARTPRLKEKRKDPSDSSAQMIGESKGPAVRMRMA